jgi:tetratricopeptide (TPR) repeat protein
VERVIQGKTDRAVPDQRDAAGKGIAVAGLLILGLLPVIGKFLPATLAWGFGHLAFLPAGAWVASIAGWLLLFVPPLRRRSANALYGTVGGLLFGPSIWPAFLLAAVCFALFRFLSTPTHLLGDGVLIGELVARGAQFRVHDLMDYLLHRLALSWIGKAGSDPASFSLYAWTSISAGFAGILVAIALLRRMRVAREVKVFAFFLWLFSTSTLLYCGYVESYAWLSVAILGFLWSGFMAERDEISPLAPGIFFGLALFLHTLALVAAPALVWLAWRLWRARRGDRRAQVRRLVLLFAPAIVLPMTAAIVHVALGFNREWFRKEFVQSKNQKQILIRLTGADGILSLKYVKNVLNWLVLVLPVSGWLLALKFKSLRDRLREPGIGFLLLHSLVFGIAFVLMDRKLGPARDWDILTPQIAGFILLAAILWEKDLEPEEERGVRAQTSRMPSLRLTAIWVAFLFLWPWITVNASRVPSLERFAAIKADFPTFPRAYATEELAKYYRDHSDWKRALPLYEECVRIYPKNPRTRVLLGSAYSALERDDDALAQFNEALAIDPNAWLALSMKGRITIKRKDYPAALEAYRRLTAIRRNDPDAWAGYGYAALRQDQYAEAQDAFIHAAGLRADPQLCYYVGVTSAYIKSWDTAVEYLNRAIRMGAKDALATFTAAAAIEGRIAAAGVRTDGSGAWMSTRSDDREQLIAARNLAMRSVATTPGDSSYASYLRHLDAVLAGRELPANWLRP